MTLLRVPLAPPKVILFDWHATLVDTLDAMYHAVDDVIPKLSELELIDRLIKIEDCKTLEDAKLVKYVIENQRLHPKIKSARKISRTDIFEVLFGPDQEAKKIAHQAFDHAYRNYFGEVKPFEDCVESMLEELYRLQLKVGVLTNRSREFMMHELDVVNETGWRKYFQTVVCGNDVTHRKPDPEQILVALGHLEVDPSLDCWYVGDSTTDIIAAKRAGVTAVFYNGAGWDTEWIDKIFPGTVKHPHKPDTVVNNFREFMHLVRLDIAAVSE